MPFDVHGALLVAVVAGVTALIRFLPIRYLKFLRRILLRLLQLMFSDRLQASYKITPCINLRLQQHMTLLRCHLMRFATSPCLFIRIVLVAL